MKIIWIGHAGFRIEIDGQVLLVDPWMAGNPLFEGHDRAAAIAGATAILITHGHGDHAAEAPQIARDLGIPIACGHELSEIWNAEGGIDTIGFGKGGTIRLGEVAVTMVNATHSASIDYKGAPLAAGSEAGFMIAGEGHTVYVSGDTDVMADMAVFQALHEPDIGILACGGHYTMDMRRAAYAARTFFDFRSVIPCHYRTFPFLAQSAAELVEGLPGVCVIEPEVMTAIDL